MAPLAPGSQRSEAGTVHSWTAATRVAFVPKGKTPGTASHDRYEKYKHAKTVAEALELGASKADLRWDFARGLLKLKVSGTGARAKHEAVAVAKQAGKAARKAAELVGKRAKQVAKLAGKVAKKVVGTTSRTRKATADSVVSAKRVKAAEGAEEAEEAGKGKAQQCEEADCAKQEAAEKRRSHTSYLPETYMAVTRWMEETQIRYRPHAKRPGSKSYVRYERYSKAKTVGQSLELGSFPADWCWDLERGFIKVLGPVRDEPLAPTSEDTEGRTAVDRTVGKWYKREAARMLGVDLQALSQDKSWAETILLRLKRSVAERRAGEILADCDATGRKVNEADVLHVLQAWGFRHNTSRENVMPEGSAFVSSDTMGIIPSRDGRIIASRESLDYPNFVRVVNRWLKDHFPAELKGRMCYTSININKNYSARLHRDGNNVGPSLIKAFGNFQGGVLNYWSDDNRQCKLEELPEDGRASLDLSTHLALFDGRRGHSVDDFTGERYTLVYFTCARYDQASQELRTTMLDRGMIWPTPQAAKQTLQVLKPPAGYSSGKPPHEGKFLCWRV